jgi:glutathione S-transferase
MKIWGRNNSSNVQKVLWLLAELDIPFDRVDAGMAHGVVNTPDYRAKNPNGRVPTLEDDGFVLWESNSILRYISMRHPALTASLYPTDPAARASVDRWLDWQLSTVTPAERDLFWGMIRTKPEDRDMTAINAAIKASAACWAILEDRLLSHKGPFIEGANFTLADIVLGVYVRRWFTIEVPDRPALPAVGAWYARLQARPSFAVAFVAPLT